MSHDGVEPRPEEPAGRDDAARPTVGPVKATFGSSRPSAAGRGRRAALGLGATAAVLLVSVALAVAAGAARSGATASPPPSTTPGSSPASSSASSPRFDGSGVSFSYPATWRLEHPATPPGALQTLAVFSRGLPACADAPAPSASSGGLGDMCPFSLPMAPDSMTLMVALGSGGPPASLTIAGQPAAFTESPGGQHGADVTFAWSVRLPGRSRDSVAFLAFVRGPDTARIRAELEAMLATLTLAASPAPSPLPASVGRYPGGIPETLGGQPVYVGLAAVLHAESTSDATPFLVGGWFPDGSANICSHGIGMDPSPLLGGCGTVVGGTAPWTPYAWPGPQGQMYWNGLRLPDDQGPSIVRVHTHDPSAAACRPDDRATCETVLVVDAVLWAGDDWTQTAPLSVADAVGRLGTLNIMEQVPMPGQNAILAVQRHLFVTPRAGACPAPWPQEVFDLHGDARFGLVAVFPDQASRETAQASLDPSAPGCDPDPRVIRPDPGSWVGVANVLVLVYGDARLAAATGQVLTSSGTEPPVVPFPPRSLDESYRVVLDFEAARASGTLDAAPPLAQVRGEPAATQDAYRRYAANALAFSIGTGRPPTEADIGAARWKALQQWAVAGTARLFTIDHPTSTDPALRIEVLVAFEQRQPAASDWGLLLVSPTPSEIPSP